MVGEINQGLSYDRVVFLSRPRKFYSYRTCIHWHPSQKVLHFYKVFKLRNSSSLTAHQLPSHSSLSLVFHVVSCSSSPHVPSSLSTPLINPSPPFLLQSTWLVLTFTGDWPPQPSVNMQGFYSKLDSSPSSSPLLGVGMGREGAVPLSLAVETEKAQALLQTFSSASLLASAGLGMFCVVADHALQLSVIQNHLWLRAALDNATHGLVGLWSWAVVIGLRKKSDLYEVLLAGLLASIIDLDHFYMAGSLSLKVRSALLLRGLTHSY